jgi:hypothetical protein
MFWAAHRLFIKTENKKQNANGHYAKQERPISANKVAHLISNLIAGAVLGEDQALRLCEV